jgi:hypothetical protein
MWQRILVAFLVPAASLFLVPLARAGTITDSAGVFSAKELEWCRNEIEGIERDYHVEILVETFPSLPWMARMWTQFRGPAARERYLDDWVRRRAKRVGGAGIMFLVCRDPFAVRVYIGSALRDMTPEDARQLGLTLSTGGGKGQSWTLGPTLVRLRDMLHTRYGQTRIVPSPLSWNSLMWVLLALVVFSAVTMQLRRAKREPAVGGGAMAPGLSGGLGMTLYGLYAPSQPQHPDQKAVVKPSAAAAASRPQSAASKPQPKGQRPAPRRR